MTKISSLTSLGDLGRFVDGDEREQLAGDREPIIIRNVRDDLGHKFAGKAAPRYLFDAVIEATGELVTIGLGTNTGRDALVANLRRTWESGETLDPVVLVMYVPEGADPPEKGERWPAGAFWTFDDATDDDRKAAAGRERKAPETDKSDERPTLRAGKRGKA